MHLAHAKTRSPFCVRIHCKLGYFLIFCVGLYFPRNLTKDQDIPDFLEQMVQILLAIECTISYLYLFCNI